MELHFSENRVVLGSASMAQRGSWLWLYEVVMVVLQC
jgi:hypothetical protein